MLDELEVLIPVPKCTCSLNCTCDALGQVKDQRNILHVTHFLKSLNEQFFVARSQIMLMTPLPSLNHMFGMIVQQESWQFFTEYSDLPKALVVSTAQDSKKPSGSGAKQGSNKSCSFCGK